MPQRSQQSQGSLDHAQVLLWRGPLHAGGQPARPQSPRAPLQNRCRAEQRKAAVLGTRTPRLPLGAAPHPASAAGAAAPVSPDGCAPGVALLPAFFSRIRSSSCRTRSRRLRRSVLASAGMDGSWASAVTLCRRPRSPARSCWVGRGAHGQSRAHTAARNTRNRRGKPGASHTRCRGLAVPGGAVPGCVPPSCPWPGARAALTGGAATRSSEEGGGGPAAAGGEGLVACRRAEGR